MEFKEVETVIQDELKNVQIKREKSDFYCVFGYKHSEVDCNSIRIYTKLNLKNIDKIHLCSTSEVKELNYIKKHKEYYEVLIDFKLDIRKIYTLEIESGSQKYHSRLYFDKYYSSEEFNSLYTPNMDYKLGSFNENNKTYFRVFAPFATEVKLNLKTDIKDEFKQYKMNYQNNGCYEVVLNEVKDLSIYTFTVTNFGITYENVVDPYCYSCLENGTLGVFIDWNKHKIDNKTLETIKSFYTTKPVVCEIHVKDFSMSDTFITKNTEVKGKYLGLIEKNVKNSYGDKVGFDYMKELSEKGLTHIQILPFYQFLSAHENNFDKDFILKTSHNNYNWGYGPLNYNCLEAHYSSNPNDPLCRIKEMISVIKEYASINVGVIMDVVFNHVPSQLDSKFEMLAPDYYFRLSSTSNAGADMNTTRKMFKKFIIDSCCMFTENYGMSGFRFDLMGLLDLQAMRELSDKVHKINKNSLIYGEAWDMFDANGNIHQLDENKDYLMAIQKNLHVLDSTNSCVGAFNDTFRDGMKGHVFDCKVDGYCQKVYKGYNKKEVKLIKQMHDDIVFGIMNSNPNKKELISCKNYIPYSEHNIFNSVNYVECHDNLPLFDKLVITLHDENIARKIANLCTNLVLLSNGISFYQIGQEFFRTKEVTALPENEKNRYLEDEFTLSQSYILNIDDTKRVFCHNSYASGVILNAINWDNVTKYKEYVEQFKKYLSYRKNEMPVYPNIKMMKENVSFDKNGRFGLSKQDYLNSVNYIMKDDNNEYLASFNFSNKPLKLKIEDREFVVTPLSSIFEKIQ